MEGLTRLVTESLARYGLDRPVDFRRLQWSRWFRCESHHSLLHVPSKPGVFALAEDVMALQTHGLENNGAADALVRRVERSSTPASASSNSWDSKNPAEPESARMLAVLQFGEDDDMAFVLDRMFSRENPMRARLVSGRCFVRYVVIEDATERRNTCNALNQWMISSGEKATGIGAHFATSLELPTMGRTLVSDRPDPSLQPALNFGPKVTHPPQDLAQHPNYGSATNIHCPQPLPSGF
jgi:hypothetical protein